MALACKFPVIWSKSMTAQPLGSRYLLDDLIGQGGMGVVWRGRDRETGDSCAIKLLRSEFAADPAAVTRFVRERTALVRFRHPNVVTLRDMIVEGDCLALVMDFVAGGDLSAYRRGCGGTLPLDEALRVTAQVCEALAAAHAAGIVHRDLKPANILLDEGQVRLADFGIARIVGESPATTTGMVIGTIGFMAPEVIRGEEPSPACDVYAVGITLYELLAGVQPFTGQAVAVMRDHLDTMPTRPDGMPDRLWALVSACLNKDPARRPLAAAVARTLRDRALLGDQAPLGEPTPPGQATSYGGRYRGSPAAPPGAADGTSSGPVASARPAAHERPVTYQGRQSGPVHPAHSGPVTASARLRAMAAPGGPSPTGPAPGMAGLAGMPVGLASRAGAASPETEVVLAGASPQTDAVAVGIGGLSAGPVFDGPVFDGAAGLPPTPGGKPGRHGDGGSRRLGIRPVWAGAAAVVLVFAGVAGTYLTMSGPSAGQAAGPTASPLVTATQSQPAVLAGSASPAARHRPTSSVQPTATDAGTPAAAATAGTSSSAPSGTPGSAAPTGANLVADGDFSDPTLSAWNHQVLNTTVVSAGARGGSAAQMTGGPTAGVSQIVTGLVPDKEYELTGWIISDTGNYSTYIGAKAYDSGTGVSRALNSTTWSEIVLTFTPAPGHTTAEVFCWQAVAGTGYCTDVSVRAMS